MSFSSHSSWILTKTPEEHRMIRKRYSSSSGYIHINAKYMHDKIPGHTCTLQTEEVLKLRGRIQNLQAKEVQLQKENDNLLLRYSYL